MRPESFAVLGLGEIGGSAAWGARAAGVPRVVGWSPSRADGTQALRGGAVHELADRADRAVSRAAVVLLAQPEDEAPDLLRRIAPHLDPEAIVLLLSEAHQATLGRATALGLEDRVAAVHLMGGALSANFSSADSERWRGQFVYLSGAESERGSETVRSAVSFVEETLGAAPVLISALRHDEQIAWTRHLPRAAAAIVAHLLLGRGPAGATWDRAAAVLSGAASGPMVVDAETLLANRAAVGEALAALGAEVGVLRKLLEEGDEAALHDFLQAAARFRPRVS